VLRKISSSRPSSYGYDQRIQARGSNGNSPVVCRLAFCPEDCADEAAEMPREEAEETPAPPPTTDHWRSRRRRVSLMAHKSASPARSAANPPRESREIVPRAGNVDSEGTRAINYSPKSRERQLRDTAEKVREASELITEVLLAILPDRRWVHKDSTLGPAD
jgi:hypothetical protein